jgi:hypothetical protein
VVLICSSKEFVTTVPFPRTPTYSMYDSHAHPVPSDSPSDWSCASGIARESKYWLVGVIAGFVPILLMLDSTVWVPTWFWDQYTILQNNMHLHKPKSPYEIITAPSSKQCIWNNFTTKNSHSQCTEMSIRSACSRMFPSLKGIAELWGWTYVSL